MKKKLYIGIVALFILLGSPLLYILTTSTLLERQNGLYRYWALSHLSTQYLESDESAEDVMERASLYIELIEEDFLLDGMVINHDVIRKPLDVCDSLLFTSLYFISLKKLGHHQRADSVWAAIKKSKEGGKWLRHPQCPKPASRDMVLGILAAFSQDLPDAKPLLQETLKYIKLHKGFFSHGSVDVSFLTPGVAEFFRIYAKAYSIESHETPYNLQYSFSTSEFSALGSSTGYQTHLIALQSWIEMELLSKPKFSKELWQRNALLPFNALGNLTGTRPVDQRISWITEKIYSADPNNLFYKWLRLKSAGALTPQTRKLLLFELANMPQFPRDRLPENCDRSADYLWQRDSAEHFSQADVCTKTFNGVDFIWMAALLLEDELGPEHPTLSPQTPENQ